MSPLLFPLTQFLVPRSTCSYMRLFPTLNLLASFQRSSVRCNSFHLCCPPFRSVSDVLPGYRKSFSSIPSNKMSSSEGLSANLYSASVTTPNNLSGSPEDISSHHLKNGFTNPWPRYIYIQIPAHSCSAAVTCCCYYYCCCCCCVSPQRIFALLSSSHTHPSPPPEGGEV